MLFERTLKYRIFVPRDLKQITKNLDHIYPLFSLTVIEVILMYDIDPNRRLNVLIDVKVNSVGNCRLSKTT